MNDGASSREKILDRIRRAIPGAAASGAALAEDYAALPREYVRAGRLDADGCVELMAHRLREYDAEVVECGAKELPETIAAQLAASGRRAFVAPPGFPAEWLAAGFDWRIDHGLTAEEVETAEAVVTAAFCGVADSGTIVLHHSAIEGRRVLTLLPDWHLCILRASQVVETFPEYFDRCQVSGIRDQGRGDEGTREQGNEKLETRDLGTEGLERVPRLVTWISGPSATADIEMTRIKGVHGPRFLHVILVKD
jgi:L-lactate dehydrogenase complex protein LldG